MPRLRRNSRRPAANRHVLEATVGSSHGSSRTGRCIVRSSPPPPASPLLVGELAQQRVEADRPRPPLSAHRSADLPQRADVDLEERQVTPITDLDARVDLGFGAHRQHRRQGETRDESETEQARTGPSPGATSPSDAPVRSSYRISATLVASMQVRRPGGSPVFRFKPGPGGGPAPVRHAETARAQAAARAPEKGIRE